MLEGGESTSDRLPATGDQLPATSYH